MHLICLIHFCIFGCALQRWSAIATHLPGRTDNEIKNFWNTHLKKKLIQMGFDPMTHQPRTDDLFSSLPHLIALANLTDPLLDEHSMKLQAEALHLANFQCLQHLLQSAVQASVTTSPFSRNGITDMDAYNNSLLNSLSVPPIKESSILNSPYELQNVLSQSVSHEIGSSQLLHHQIPINQFADPQVLFKYQTPLNTESNGPSDSKKFIVVSQGENNNPLTSSWAQLDPYDDHDYYSPDFSVLPPLTEEVSMNINPGDGSSSASSYGRGASPCWPELCFEGPLFS